MFIDLENECFVDMNCQEIMVGDRVVTTVKNYAELQICTVVRFTACFIWVQSKHDKKPVRKAMDQVVKVP